MTTVGLFAYGEMGYAAFVCLLKDFTVSWIILSPQEENSAKSTRLQELARKNGVKVIHSNSNEFIHKMIKEYIPQAVIIATYNKVIPKETLELTKFINVHHGYLPRWRGRASINWAIIKGKKDIGLTIHNAAADLDAGKVYAQYIVPIDDKDTIKTIYDKFNTLIDNNLANVVKKVIKGYRGRKQMGNPTYCCTRIPDDGLIDWSLSSREIYNLIRALTKPYPGAFTYYDGRKLIVWESEFPKNPRTYEASIPGRVSAIYKNYGVEVLTGDSSIIIKTVSCNGKEQNASEIIKSVKESLGINLVKFYEQFQAFLNKRK